MNNTPEAFTRLPIFLMNEQPFTCPHCGARCIDIASFYHTNAKALIEQCLNEECGLVCFEEEDAVFLKRL